MRNTNGNRRELFDQVTDLRRQLRRAQRGEVRKSAARMVEAAALVMTEAYHALDAAYGRDPNDEAVRHARGVCGEWDVLREMLE